jgi:hypothetical protein
MQQKRTRSLTLLVLAGLCSFPLFFGIIELFKLLPLERYHLAQPLDALLRSILGGLFVAGPGVFFGFTVSAYFVRCERFRDPAKVILFVTASGIAFWASIIAALPLVPLFGDDFPGPFKGNGPMSLPFHFGAGYIGAFLVMLAGRLAFGEPRTDRRAIGRAMLLSIAGGAAGVAGGLTDRAFDEFNRSTDLQWICPLTIWPAIGALLLGLFLKQEKAGSESEALTSLKLE